ncbi:hypothetical protein JOM56_005389 [Amanita muscaria]
MDEGKCSSVKPDRVRCRKHPKEDECEYSDHLTRSRTQIRVNLQTAKPWLISWSLSRIHLDTRPGTNTVYDLRPIR